MSRERQVHPTEPVRWMTRTVHAVSEQTGRPLMFFNSAGEAVRRPQDTTLWGRTAATLTAGPELPRRREDEEADPGLLYAGQWRDAESGLCYNRFRYYEPESGMYLVSDPLGLQGGEQTYRYVPNPCGYVDPLGLTTCPLVTNGIATVIWHDNRGAANSFGHYSIEVKFGDEILHTHQLGVPGSTTRVSTNMLDRLPVSKTAVFDLPDAKAAIEFQKSVLDKIGPLYDVKTQSCVTHVMDVLRAGGLDVPESAGAQLKFLLKNMMLP